MADNATNQDLKRFRIAIWVGVPIAVGIVLLLFNMSSSGNETGEENTWIKNLGWVLVVVGISCILAGAFLSDKIKQMGKPAIVAGIIFLIYSISGVQNLIDAGVDTIDKHAAEEANELRAGDQCPTEPQARHEGMPKLTPGLHEIIAHADSWTRWHYLPENGVISEHQYRWEQAGLCVAIWTRKGSVLVVPLFAGDAQTRIPFGQAFAYAGMGQNIELKLVVQ